jgi:glycosyltransferase involved in cell wall biosynthesis
MGTNVATRQYERRRTDRLAGPSLQVSVVIPCLNEAENIQECVTRAQSVLAEMGLASEVIVVDNGSDDGSAELARQAGATVIVEPRRGYGQAYLTGFEAASGEYIVMIDADLTYDFAEIPRFVAELDDGAELVMGNRMGDIQPGAMTLVSRVGNPIMTGVLNLVHRSPIQDAQCGMRAFRRDVLGRLALHAKGFEFASEMVIRAAKEHLDVREFPIKLHQRGGESKLSPFRDGWRNLRLILVHSPNVLFIVPGFVMTALGALIELAVFAHVSIFGRAWYLHALIGGAALVIVGVQVIGLGLCGRAYATFVMGQRDPLFERLGQRYGLEHGLVLAVAVGASGVALAAIVFGQWVSSGFGSLVEERLTIVALTLVVAGIQIFFTSFLISLLGLRRSDAQAAPAG